MKGKGEHLISNGKRDGGDFIVSELKEQKLTVKEFPGYDNVNITYDELRIIINQEISSWKGALANIKGIYLLTDITTGKHYVGSACGDIGIWQRWTNYSMNGHGGNVELKKILQAKTNGYYKNFIYSILEIADKNTSDEYILKRECYWKGVLLSRKFGYNKN